MMQMDGSLLTENKAWSGRAKLIFFDKSLYDAQQSVLVLSDGNTQWEKRIISKLDVFLHYSRRFCS